MKSLDKLILIGCLCNGFLLLSGLAFLGNITLPDPMLQDILGFSVAPSPLLVLITTITSDVGFIFSVLLTLRKSFVWWVLLFSTGISLVLVIHRIIKSLIVIHSLTLLPSLMLINGACGLLFGTLIVLLLRPNVRTIFIKPNDVIKTENGVVIILNPPPEKPATTQTKPVHPIAESAVKKPSPTTCPAVKFPQIKLPCPRCGTPNVYYADVCANCNFILPQFRINCYTCRALYKKDSDICKGCGCPIGIVRHKDGEHSH